MRAGTAHPLPPLAAVAAGLGLLAASGGCAEPRADASLLDDSTYVQVMARLSFIRHRAEDEGWADGARWADSARREVLEAYGLEPDDLARYVAAHGEDPRHMQAVWERVGEVYDDFALRAVRAEGPVDLGPQAGRPAADTAAAAPGDTADAADAPPAGNADPAPADTAGQTSGDTADATPADTARETASGPAGGGP